MKRLRRLVFGLAGAGALLLSAGQLGLLAGQPPIGLGVHSGKLLPPSETPNSVSSQADLHPGHPQQAHARIAPFPLHNGDPVASLASLASVVHRMPGTSLKEQRTDYLRAQAQTRWLKFVDDLEFWFNPATRVIEVRSASRLGRTDFGMNRERIEAIRAEYLSRR